MSSKRPGQKPRKENYISDSDSDTEGKKRGGFQPTSNHPVVTPAVSVCPVPNKTVQSSGYSDEFSMTKVTPQQPPSQYPVGCVTNPPGNYVPTSVPSVVQVCPPGNYVPTYEPSVVQVCPVPPQYPTPGVDCGPINPSAYPPSYPANPPSNQFGIGFTSSGNPCYPPANPSPGWAASCDIGFQPGGMSGAGGSYPPVNPGSQSSYNVNANYMAGMPQPDSYSSGTNFYQLGDNANYQSGASNYQPGVPRY